MTPRILKIKGDIMGKKLIFSKYATNLKTIISHRSLRISGFFFAFLIDIVNNIPCSPYYVTRTSANGSAVYWSRDTGGNHVTSILDCLPALCIKHQNSDHIFFMCVILRFQVICAYASCYVNTLYVIYYR